MVISPIDFEIKRPNQKASNYCKGRIGGLQEKNFGSNSPTGICKLYVEGDLKDTLHFNSVQRRSEIFDFWKRMYISKNTHCYIEVSYKNTNMARDNRYRIPKTNTNY
jgi:hypothetical protein